MEQVLHEVEVAVPPALELVRKQRDVVNWIGKPRGDETIELLLEELLLRQDEVGRFDTEVVEAQNRVRI